MRTARTIVAVILALLAVASRASAEGDRIQLREWGIRAGAGANPSSVIQYYAIHPYVGLALWDPASQWFARHDINALWVLEPWAAYVNDDHGLHKTDSFELGLNALFIRLVFGEAALRPFVEAGEGIVYTDLRKQDLGTRIQFTSTFGLGIEYAVRPDLAVGFQARIRHMSNAGMASSNPGINTLFGLVGVTFR